MLEKYQNYRTSDLDLAINLIGIHPLDVLVTGVTGAGKSSTLNSVFSKEIAKVGRGADPETMDLTSYRLNHYLRLWDSPGLGDGVENDEKHACAIIDKLNEKDNNGDPLIDLILVILDGSSRDYKTSFELINKVLIPTIGEESKKRILVAINQADMAMKGKNWDYEKNKPEAKLVEFLEDKVKSVRNRIKDATGVDIEPIYYSAGYKEDGKEQLPYNLSKLLNFILNYTSEEKRLSYVNSISQNKKMWEHNEPYIVYDDYDDYDEYDNYDNYEVEHYRDRQKASSYNEANRRVIERSAGHVLSSTISGAKTGYSIGSKFGGPVGGVVCGVIGAVGGFLMGLF